MRFAHLKQRCCDATIPMTFRDGEVGDFPDIIGHVAQRDHTSTNDNAVSFCNQPTDIAIGSGESRVNPH